MWLLSERDGENAPEFGSLAEFRSYWKLRMVTLRGTRVKGSAPLAFEVGEFRSDKRAGKSSVDAKYTVTVRPRGRIDRTPGGHPHLLEPRCGPDNMWYLDSGTLPTSAGRIFSPSDAPIPEGGGRYPETASPLTSPRGSSGMASALPPGPADVRPSINELGVMVALLVTSAPL